jgi:hypothetical protein
MTRFPPLDPVPLERIGVDRIADGEPIDRVNPLYLVLVTGFTGSIAPGSWVRSIPIRPRNA